jgi:hypothetical protein
MKLNARKSKMKLIKFSVLFAVGAVLSSIHSASGQAISATMQTASPRVTTTRNAPPAKPVARPAIAPRFVPQTTGLNPQRFNANLPRTITQPPANLQRAYTPLLQTSNPAFAASNVQRSGPGQQAISVDRATRQTELRTLAAMRQRRGVVTREGNILDPPTRDAELRTLETVRERHAFGTNNQTLGTINPHRHVTKHDPEDGPQRERPEPPKDADGKKWHNKKDHIRHDEAFRRHWHESHDRNWWHNHCESIVFVNTGYYFLDGSYWYPAYGYDPLQSYYDYDGPIYTYSNLLPDEVIANVQTSLQDAGYYYGPITGSLSVDTRAAIANFQRDYGLPITGAIDEPTVEALGLYQTDDSYNFQTDQGY